MRLKILVILCLLLVVTVSGCTFPEAGTGKLVLQITDRPSLDIEKADVTIANVQVHVPSPGDNDSAEWVTVEEGPLTFDLIQIQDVEEYLGEKQLPVGRYTQIRMDVVSALVTINGTVHNLTIPSKTVKLVKSFEIKEGQTTTLTLDFDAQESIHETGKDEYIMSPTIKVLTPSNGNGQKTTEEKCEESGGTVTTSMCCLSTEDFPNLCLIGPCVCAPENSHEVQICDCGEDKCFNGNDCVDLEEPEEPEDISCSTDGESMLLSEARQITENSDCVENGTIKETYQCNSDTGTWWIDLDIEEPGCNPACVINITSEEPEINWRCTGA